SAGELRQTRLDQLQHLDDVDTPIEIQTDFGRAAGRFRLDARDAEDTVHRLFDGTSDGNQSLVGRCFAVIDDDDDAREISLRKDGDRKLPRGVKTSGAQQSHDYQNGAILV